MIGVYGYYEPLSLQDCHTLSHLESFKETMVVAVVEVVEKDVMDDVKVTRRFLAVS